MSAKRQAKVLTNPVKCRKDWLRSLDRRTSLYRTLRMRAEAMAADLGAESLADLSVAQRTLIERACFMSQYLLELELDHYEGKKFDPGRYQGFSMGLLGIFKTLGVKRQPRTLSLDDYAQTLQETDS